MGMPFEGNPNGMCIGVTPALKSPSTILQLDSTSKGFASPRMTTAQMNAIAAPIEGLEIFNTTTHTKWFYNGTTWTEITSGGGVYTSNNGITQTASNFALGGTNPLLADTSILVGIYALTIGVLKTNSAGVLVGSGTLDASAIFQANSTTKGAILPRMTAAERLAIGSPAVGLTVYQTDGGNESGFWYYDGVVWICFNRHLIEEHFIGNNSVNGEQLVFGTSVNGDAALVSSTFNSVAGNEGSATLYGRQGIVYAQTPITGAGRASFYQLLYVSVNNQSAFYYETEVTFNALWSAANNGAFAGVGVFANSIITSNALPNYAIYIRPAYTDEANNQYKFCIAYNSVEVVIHDSGIAFSATGQWVKTGMFWNGFNDTIYFYFSNGIASTVFSIPNIIATYPTLASTNMNFGLKLCRPSVNLSGSSVVVAFDAIRRYIPQVPFFQKRFI